MNKNDSVIIRKVAVNCTAENNYINGHKSPGITLPIQYEVEGELMRDVVLGETLLLLRRRRNQVQAPGIFETSPVESVLSTDGVHIIRTANSVYYMTAVHAAVSN